MHVLFPNGWNYSSSEEERAEFIAIQPHDFDLHLQNINAFEYADIDDKLISKIVMHFSIQTTSRHIDRNIETNMPIVRQSDREIHYICSVDCYRGVSNL